MISTPKGGPIECPSNRRPEGVQGSRKVAREFVSHGRMEVEHDGHAGSRETGHQGSLDVVSMKDVRPFPLTQAPHGSGEGEVMQGPTGMKPPIGERSPWDSPRTNQLHSRKLSTGACSISGDRHGVAPSNQGAGLAGKVRLGSLWGGPRKGTDEENTHRAQPG